jgi:hypothetical protein
MAGDKIFMPYDYGKIRNIGDIENYLPVVFSLQHQ